LKPSTFQINNLFGWLVADGWCWFAACSVGWWLMADADLF
jgi:hypothetical protein